MSENMRDLNLQLSPEFKNAIERFKIAMNTEFLNMAIRKLDFPELLAAIEFQESERWRTDPMKLMWLFSLQPLRQLCRALSSFFEKL